MLRPQGFGRQNQPRFAGSAPDLSPRSQLRRGCTPHSSHDACSLQPRIYLISIHYALQSIPIPCPQAHATTIRSAHRTARLRTCGGGVFRSGLPCPRDMYMSACHRSSTSPCSARAASEPATPRESAMSMTCGAVSQPRASREPAVSWRAPRWHRTLTGTDETAIDQAAACRPHMGAPPLPLQAPSLQSSSSSAGLGWARLWPSCQRAHGMT